MNLKEILTNNGIELELAEKCSQAINGELHKEFIPKAQYNKKVVELQELKEKSDDLGAVNTQLETLKQQLQSKEEEFANYKKDIEKTQKQSEKINIIKEQLKNDGIKNNKLIDLLIKEVEVDNVEIEEGRIKDWDNIGMSLKENYSDFYTTTEIKGNEPTNPPVKNQNKFTKEDIQKMTTEEINQNWQNISEILKQ